MVQLRGVPMHQEVDGVIARVEAELRSQVSAGMVLSAQPYWRDLVQQWQTSLAQEPHRFIDPDFTIRQEALRNFRRDQIFITDFGGVDLSLWKPRNWIDGLRRGMRRRFVECLDTLKDTGDLDLLRKYPCPEVGNPHIFTRAWYRYTYRWHKHIHYLGLLQRVLQPRLSTSFTALDIGSSYGLFSYLLKSEYPDSRLILVDFPEQLLLAYYFLASCFPHARIAGAKELQGVSEITRDVLEPYDFVLIPVSWYKRLAPGVVDLVTNFVSFAEMSRTMFRYYLDAPVFTSARYFFTVNRIQSAPTYDTDLTILDYPLSQPLHFCLSPTSTHVYKRKHLFFYERKTYPSPFFEYIGMLAS